MPFERASLPRNSVQSHSTTARRRSLGHLSPNIAEKASAYPPDGGDAADQGLLHDAEMGHYEQLPKPGPSKFSWIDFFKRKPVLISLAALVGLLYLFSSGHAPSLAHARDGEVQFSGGKAGEDSNTDFEGLGAQDNLDRPHLPAGGEQASEQGKCVPILGMPDHQYALMIDAGSTGSRIHIYEFAFCQSTSSSLSSDVNTTPLPTLRNELFYQLQPGLSSFAGRPMEAAESLRPLLQHALEAVPASEHRCTPVAVKATAGLRLLGKKQSDAILKQVRTWLEAEFPFAVPGPDAVQIMDGKDEGVYAWITINYLLGLIGPAAKAGESAAVMDLGGASTQIVFEPTFPSDDLSLSPGDHVYELSLPSGKHTLYQHSHLGYGLMQARRAVHNLIAFSYVWQAAPKGVALEWEDLNAETRIPTPCLVKDGTKEVQLDPPGRKPVTVTFVGTGAGFEACRRVVDVVMAKDALCEVEPCAFGGVYQPKLMETFGKGPIYALSYFYDRIVPLGLGVDSADFSIADLRQLTKDVCSGPEDGWSRFKGNKEAMAELEDRPEYCLDMTFLHSLLSLGYELAEERQIRTGKKLDNVELGWALGAGLALIGDANIKCTA